MSNTFLYIGGRIRALRKSRGWSQADLASRLGATQAQVSKWELGKIDPSATNIVRLSRVFDVPVAYLCDGVDAGEQIQTEAPGDLGDFSEIVGAIAEELSVLEKIHPGMAAGFLMLLREGLLDTPEDVEDLLSLVEIFQRRSQRSPA